MLPQHVQAKVVDIRSPKALLPNQVVVDANVLFVIYYPNFALLPYAKAKQPPAYQTREYPRWYQRAEKGGTKFFASPLTMGEFARVVQYHRFGFLLPPGHKQTEPYPKKPGSPNPPQSF